MASKPNKTRKDKGWRFLGVSVPPELLVWLDRQAEKRVVSRSVVVRDVLLGQMAKQPLSAKGA